MRSLGMLTLMMIFSGSMAFGQNEAFGPKAKNRKIQSKMIVKDKKLFLQDKKELGFGPEFKNATPWKPGDRRISGSAIVANNPRKNLKGPAFKNWKPGK